MVAELGRLNNQGRGEYLVRDPWSVSGQHGVVVLAETRWLHWRWVGLQTLVALTLFVAIIVGFDHSVMATDGARAAPPRRVRRRHPAKACAADI